MNRWFWRGVIGLVAVGIITVAVLLVLPKPPIPGPIKQQLTSTLLLPTNNRFVVDRQSAKYDKTLKLLTFNVSSFGQKVVVSEAPTPDQFTDVPQAYQKVLDSMSDFADFDSGIGTVHLTRPANLAGKEAAVLNAKGTLLFAKPSSDLTEDQWRQFFTSFSTVQ